MPRRPASTSASIRMARTAWLALLLAGLIACRSASTPAQPTADNFPVVEPFAIDRAGSTVTVEFTLPNAMDGDHLRPVFIGFRAVKTPSRDDAEFQAARKVMHYLDREALPVRVRLWRMEGDRTVPVVPQELHYDAKADRFWYEPVAADGVVTHHEGTGDDAMELMAIGKFDLNHAYYVHQIARIIPPTPGRYRLQIESLTSHAILHGLRYELLVSHHHAYGIR